jgi:UDPglucose--hexose-1-phosphate uridylyltransferase
MPPRSWRAGCCAPHARRCATWERRRAGRTRTGGTKRSTSSSSEAEEASGERLVFGDHHAVVFAPAASRSAFELMVVPRGHRADFTELDDDAISDTCATLQRALRALGALGDPPYNLFLHTSPAGERLDQTFHWHWEIHPRLRVIAGLERATALSVNPAAPEYAAELLRTQLDSA